MRIAVDLDGPCYEFQRTYRYMIREYRGVEMPPVDEFWVKWDSQLDYGTPEDHEWMWTFGVQEGLFRYGHMTTGARVGLKDLVWRGHDLAIVTHRPADSTRDTVAWLNLYMDDLPYTLDILSDGQKKTTVEWDLLIDDKTENCLDAAQAGRRALVYDRPWNSNCPSLGTVKRVKGWEGVLRSI